MEIVINKSNGGFSISLDAAKFMAKRENKQAKAEIEFSKKEKISFYGYGFSDKYKNQYSRTDPDLILAIKTLKEKANGKLAKLKIVEIPDNIPWEIVEDEYDGTEIVNEKYRSWK